MISDIKLKKEIIRFCQKLYKKGFVANHDGNISVKAGSKLWVTPSAQSKGDVTEDMLVSTDLSGKKISGNYSVFSEIDLHVLAYQLRSDIEVVIHAHPPVATSFAASQTPLSKVFIAEAIVTLGEEIPLVTEKDLSPFLPYYDVLLLQNHGVLAIGKTLEQAYYRLELVEHLAKIEWHAKSLGGVKSLPADIVQTLLEKREKQGLSRPKCPAVILNQMRNPSLEKIVEEEVRRLLK